MIDHYDLYAETLQGMFHVDVYCPYRQVGKRYPVLYINDGQNAFFDEKSFMKVSWGFLEYIKKMDLKIILVAIHCRGDKRMDDYAPWVIPPKLALRESDGQTDHMGGWGDLYIQWIIHKLIPMIDRRYPSNGDRGICGSSMGGVIASYASLTYPTVFSKCAALSTAFWFYPDLFYQLVKQQDLSSIQAFYLDLGEFEAEDEQINEWYRETNDRMDQLLKERIESYKFVFYKGAYHHESQWRKRVPIFMSFLYSEYLKEQHDD